MSTKYIFVTGWCGIVYWEGIVAASLGRLLKNRGLKVTIQKFDPLYQYRSGDYEPVSARGSFCDR